ncbi:MAG: serine hydrolase [Tepidisphaeraceae bacterium]
MNEPRGHTADGTPVLPLTTQADIDPTLGLTPAGILSMNVSDWSKFLRVHIDGLSFSGRRIIKPGTVARLHTPYDGPGTQYAAGWAVVNVLGRQFVAHDGTNGNWYARVILDPDLAYASFAVVNQGGPTALTAVTNATLNQISAVPFF